MRHPLVLFAAALTLVTLARLASASTYKTCDSPATCDGAQSCSAVLGGACFANEGCGGDEGDHFAALLSCVEAECPFLCDSSPDPDSDYDMLTGWGGTFSRPCAKCMEDYCAGELDACLTCVP